MKTASVTELKRELGTRSPKELVELCLHLSKFKKENKELLTYLLYEVADEASYINGVKLEMDQHFGEINKSTFYFIKKSVRKILRATKKYIRYSKKKETEVELLMYFCQSLQNMEPSITSNNVLMNIFDRQVDLIKKAISAMHEDLQFDFQLELDNLLADSLK